MNLMISMPGGMEWLVIVFVFLIGIPVICYRLGFRAGKRQGELEALRRNFPERL